MSLAKQEVKASDYIDVKRIKPSHGAAERGAVKVAAQLSTGRLVWLLVCRHKFGLALTGDIILILNWAFPAWFELVKSAL